MSTDLDLIRQHAHVLFDIDEAGRLVRVNESGHAPAPRLFLARGREAREVWFRADVSSDVAPACRGIVSALPRWSGDPSDPSVFDDLRRALGGAPIDPEAFGPAYVFGEKVEPGPGEAILIDESTAHLLAPHFPYTLEVFAARSPVIGVVEDGRVVSACYSARRRPDAIEVGVATEEPYRGRGYGPLVAAKWREAVEAIGAQPLYSTWWENHASRAVARKLRLIAYAETLSLD